MALDATAVLEIGTSTVRTMVGEVRDDGVVSIIGIGETQSRGIRKGEIYNRDDAIKCVRKAIKSAEENRRKSIHSIVLITSGGQAMAKKSTGFHRLVDPLENRLSEVDEQDMDEVVEIARKVALPDNRIKLHTLQQYFQLDDTVNITNPAGMAGEELRVDMLTIHAKRSAVDNFRKLVDDAPIACSDAVFSGLCSALAVVTDEQKKAGVLVIDIGGGTTDFTLYHDGFIQAAGSFAVGGDHVTNDISVGLQIPLSQAELVKQKDGSALTNLMERDHNISIPAAAQGFSGKMVRAVTLNTIINARMEEIFTLVKEAVEVQSPNVPLSAGVLLTGGGSFLNGARDLGQKVFNVPCMHGKPFDVQGLPSAKDAPLYASHVGAIRYAASLNRPVEKRSLGKTLLNLFWGGSDE
ncbi:cell division protein FtsA [Pontiella agarivorans]|uniref:Cell division protein FtsA n=1 Tax=Pontiella agarivorans TaxID=3038953 RepID=A0ABU5MUH9_9BACT|nr:cell division protein FtsA [Pontiella agarivorans]MDZ8117863.1 cell division protein FtsA [Pontiella agarivorans]